MKTLKLLFGRFEKFFSGIKLEIRKDFSKRFATLLQSSKARNDFISFIQGFIKIFSFIISFLFVLGLGNVCDRFLKCEFSPG